MTHIKITEIQRPPLPAVAAGDVVWVPVFVTDAAGGSPFWLRIIEAQPPVDRHQTVRGVIAAGPSGVMGEAAERMIEVRLPLDRVSRRAYVNRPPARR